MHKKYKKSQFSYNKNRTSIVNINSDEKIRAYK